MFLGLHYLLFYYYEKTALPRNFIEKKKKSFLRITVPGSAALIAEEECKQEPRAGTQSRKQSNQIFIHKYKVEGANWKWASLCSLKVTSRSHTSFSKFALFHILPKQQLGTYCSTVWGCERHLSLKTEQENWLVLFKSFPLKSWLDLLSMGSFCTWEILISFYLSGLNTITKHN